MKRREPTIADVRRHKKFAKGPMSLGEAIELTRLRERHERTETYMVLYTIGGVEREDSVYAEDSDHALRIVQNKEDGIITDARVKKVEE